MPTCAAINCKNRSEHKIKVHRFPKDPSRKLQWAKNANLNVHSLCPKAILCEVSFLN